MTAAAEPVAVVGIDCRFPQAPDLGALWRLLLDGGVAVGPVPPDRWGREAMAETTPGSSTPAAFIDGAAGFDHAFFGLAPAEASAMDPQQRLLLQTTWRAVEDAGIDPAGLAGSRTSVHVGLMSSEWAVLHMGDHHAMTAHRGAGNGYCMSANRISYHLDLQGPSMAVDTACSSSLVATHLACGVLRLGEADLAVAAGVNLILTPALSAFYAQAGLAAPDGRCRPYLRDGDGIGRGEGVGVVVLRRLSDALDRGDRVYAVVDGGAVVSDGRSNGLTAPRRGAQAAAVRAAHEAAGVDPHDVAFVEGHGTGTTLGDRIEVQALGEHHRGRARPAWLSSVKSNLGHLEGAAGIAGLIKACLVLQQRTVPPIPDGVEDDGLALADHGLRLPDRATRLPDGAVHAGVSSFGLGGTNAHLVLSAPPRTRRRPARAGTRPALVLPVSAASGDSLVHNVAAVRASVAATAETQLPATAWSASQVKTGLRYRVAFSGRDRGAVLAGMDRWLATPTATRPPRSAPRVALAFTGQGSQYASMGRALHRTCAPFRRHLEAASDAIGPLGSAGTVLDVLVRRDPPPDPTPTAIAQPAIFAVEYALARCLLDLGVEPVALLGHSVGEIAAACVGGALTLAEAGEFVVARGSAMQLLPPGGAMAAVQASPDRVEAMLATQRADGDVLEVAAVNGLTSVSLAGAAEAVDRALDTFAEARVPARRLEVSHAFHSELMAPAAEALRALTTRLERRRASIPWISAVDGELVSAVDPDHWARQAREPVRFDLAARTLRDLAPTHVVEVGPRPVLLGLLREQLDDHVGCAALSGPDSDGAELAGVVARLWTDGCPVTWSSWFPEESRVARVLPGYVFDDVDTFWYRANNNVDPGSGVAASPPPPTDRPPVAPRPTSRTRAAAPTVGQAPSPEPAVAEPAAAAVDVAGAVTSAITTVSGHDRSKLAPEAQLDRDLGFDSIMAMKLADELEPRLGRLDVAALLPHLSTVGDLVDHLRRVGTLTAPEQGVSS